MQFRHDELSDGQSDLVAAGWPTALALLLAGLAVYTAAYFETLSDLLFIWSGNSTYNYGFLIPLVSLYVVYLRVPDLLKIPPRRSLLGLVAVLGFSFLWLLADLVDVSLGRHLALVGLLQGVILATLGWQVCLALLFPMIYLWLMVPGWAFLVAPLQEVTMWLSTALIPLSGIPMYDEGLLIEVPSGLYRVAPECSGLNFLLAAVALSAVYAHLLYRGARKRVATVLISIAVAILANGVRVAGIIIFNHFAGSNLDIGGDHLTWGWGLFAIIVVVMMWIGMRFREDEFEEEEDRRALRLSLLRRPSLRGLVYLLPLGLVLAALPVYVWASELGRPAGYTVEPALPETTGFTPAYSDWNPEFPTAHLKLKLAFSDQYEDVELFMAYYAAQSEAHELIGYQNSVIGENHQQISGSRVLSAQQAGLTHPVTETFLGNAEGRRLVWHWYWVGGEESVNSLAAKLLQARSHLLGGEKRAAFLAVSVPVVGDPEEARSILAEVLSKQIDLVRVVSDTRVSPLGE